MSTDLVKHDAPAGAIILNEPSEQYNVLTPTLVIPDSEGIELRTSIVRLDPVRDFYQIQGRFAPSTAALFKLMDAASIYPESSKAEKASVCVKCAELHRGTQTALVCASCPHAYDVAHAVSIVQQLPGGQWRRILARYELDFVALEEELSSRSSATEQKTTAELAQKRRHRAALAESGAYARALRKALGVTSYTQAETRKPFLVHRMVTKLSEGEAAQVLERNRRLLHGFDGEDDGLCTTEPARIEGPAQVIEAEAEPDPLELYQTAEAASRVDVYALADVLRGAARDLETRNAGKVPSPAQLNLLHGLLEKVTGHRGDAAAQDRRQLFTFLLGKKHTAELSYGEVMALLNALVDQEASDRESRRYELSNDGRAMVLAVLEEQTKLKGQAPLFDEAS